MGQESRSAGPVAAMAGQRAGRAAALLRLRAALSREFAVGASAAVLGAAFWLAFVGWQGFRLSPDSMSYASLARGFDTGHPFTGTIYWRGTAPGGLQGNWPPLYPLALAAAHALGLHYPWGELVLSGVAVALACGFGAAAVHRAAGALPLAGVVLLASCYDLLYVGDWGWTEPGLDALLALMFWLCARAARETLSPSGGAAGDGGKPARGRSPWRLLFWAGLVGGLGYLQRYAAAPFLVGLAAFAAVLGLLAAVPGVAAAAPSGPSRPPDRERGRCRRAARALGAACLGAVIPALPWTVVDLAATGHLGTAYLRAGAGWTGAWIMLRQAARAAWRSELQPGLPGGEGPAALVRPLLAATAAAVALGLALTVAARLRARAGRRLAAAGATDPPPAPPAGFGAPAPAPGAAAAPVRPRAGWGPSGRAAVGAGGPPSNPGRLEPQGPPGGPALALAGLLLFCTALYTLFLVGVRARYYFDPIDLRLIAPGAFTAVLAVVLAVAAFPRAVRELAAVPLAALLLAHGAQMARLALRSPAVASSLERRWCSPGPAGDCSLFAWLGAHLDAADFLITNEPFTINLRLGLPAEQVSAYPYNPYALPRDLRRWAGRWWRLHPRGGVYVVVDTAAGAVDAGGYGPFFAGFATADGVVRLGGGWRAAPVAAAPAWRVFRVSAPGG